VPKARAGCRDTASAGCAARLKDFARGDAEARRRFDGASRRSVFGYAFAFLHVVIASEAKQPRSDKHRACGAAERFCTRRRGGAEKKEELTQRRRDAETQRCRALESGRAAIVSVIAPAARRIFRREAPSNLLFRRCGFVHGFGLRRVDPSGWGDAVPYPHIRHLCVSAPLREPFFLLRVFAPEPVLGIAKGDTRGRARTFSSPRLRASACKKQRFPNPGDKFFCTPAMPPKTAAPPNPEITFVAPCRRHARAMRYPRPRAGEKSSPNRRYLFSQAPSRDRRRRL
jgi:hypothetical protein